MKTRICIITLLLVLAASSPSIAGTWKGPFKIAYIYSYSDGSGHLIPDYSGATTQNPDNCTAYGVLQIPASMNNKMYATLLTAYLTGGNVSLYYNGCTADNMYPVLGGVLVFQVQ